MSEKIMIGCFIVVFILFLFIAVALIPNSPRIIGILEQQKRVEQIITDSNRLSFQDAEAEPNKARIFPVRESLGIFVVTAYCPCEKCCGKWADRITASGYIIQTGDKFCAADPMIPFGKVLDIPGYGVVPVLDRGGKIRGTKLDVYFDSHKDALKWGKQELEIFCWVEGE